MVVIAISGQPGCGSTTVGKLLAGKLGIKFFSLGDYTKKAALHAHKTPIEGKRARDFWLSKKGSSKEFHQHSDALQKRLARKGNIVIDAKLAVHMLDGLPDLRVWLKAPVGERAKRYAKRDKVSIAEARKILKEKENLERANWKKMYGFDYFKQEKNADIVIDVADKKPEEIAASIISSLKRVFIVHRWEGRPGRDWYPYAKKELEKSGYTVSALRMPSPDLPIMKKWVAHLSKSVGRPNEHTYLIGHSAGVITILRYLEGLNKNEKVGGCVLVAGWVDDLGYRELRNFFTKPINWPAIRRHCKKFVAIHSSNDPFVRMYHGHALKKKLGARLLIEHNKGHLTGEDRVKKLPSVVESVERFIS